ncbi:MAG: hypothetical protein ACP5LQ_05395 [Candidatus Methanodesulfokora sp.]
MLIKAEVEYMRYILHEPYVRSLAAARLKHLLMLCADGSGIT